MSWVRIDDGFTSHPKVGALTDKEFRIWVRTLCYCARYENPQITAAAVNETKGLERKTITRFHTLGLIDQREDGSYEVHDWILYSPASIKEKVAHYLHRHPDASANQIVHEVAGRRELVLAEVKRQRETHQSPNGSQPSTGLDW